MPACQSRPPNPDLPIAIGRTTQFDGVPLCDAKKQYQRTVLPRSPGFCGGTVPSDQILALAVKAEGRITETLTGEAAGYPVDRRRRIDRGRRQWDHGSGEAASARVSAAVVVGNVHSIS